MNPHRVEAFQATTQSGLRDEIFGLCIPLGQKDPEGRYDEQNEGCSDMCCGIEEEQTKNGKREKWCEPGGDRFEIGSSSGIGEMRGCGLLGRKSYARIALSIRI